MVPHLPQPANPKSASHASHHYHQPPFPRGSVVSLHPREQKVPLDIYPSLVLLFFGADKLSREIGVLNKTQKSATARPGSFSAIWHMGQTKQMKKQRGSGIKGDKGLRPHTPPSAVMDNAPQYMPRTVASVPRWFGSFLSRRPRGPLSRKHAKAHESPCESSAKRSKSFSHNRHETSRKVWKAKK